MEDEVTPPHIDRPDGTSVPPLRRKDALFLDVDGTLLEFRDDPDAVSLSEDRRRILGGAATALGGALALVSGRTLESLDDILTPLRLPAAGQHGLTRRDPQGRVHRANVDLGALEALRPRLDRFCAEHPGAFIEDKGAGLALHYRRASGAERDARALLDELEAHVPADLTVLDGKKVLEVKSSLVTKASAIAAFLREDPFAGRTPVFFGDDTTDEDGFGLVNELGGVSVKVGGGATQARHRIAEAADVWARLADVVGAPAPGDAARTRR